MGRPAHAGTRFPVRTARVPRTGPDGPSARRATESEAFLRLLCATGLRDSFEVETGRAEAVPG